MPRDPDKPLPLIFRPTKIYFVQPVGGGLIKIGRADDPEARLKALQVGSPVSLRLCRAEEAPVVWEARLHQAFAKYREHGEWFRAHPALARIADAIPDPEIPDEAIDLVNLTASPDLWLGIRCERWGVRDQAA